VKTTKDYYKHPYRRRAYLWLLLALLVPMIAVSKYALWPKISKILDDKQTTISKDITPRVIPAQAEIQMHPIPASYNLTIPYAPQAPLSNWSVHEESCEEAATYMYRAYLEGLSYPSNRVPDKEADTQFRAIKAWQVTHYGKEPDLTMSALGTFASNYYGYTPTVKKGIVENDIKTAIVTGHPVIVPVMTHSLENNMYGPSSVYHVLLIKGYDTTGVITNDAGVGNGVNKHYSWNILWQAIDAQTTKTGQGREMLYLTK